MKSRPKKFRIPVTMQLEQKDYERLFNIATAEDVAISNLARKIIIEYLNITDINLDN